jgi:nucleotide-binding universal stress UspA family protein
VAGQGCDDHEVEAAAARRHGPCGGSGKPETETPDGASWTPICTPVAMGWWWCERDARCVPKPIIAAVDPLREDVAPAALGLLLARLTAAPLVLAATYRIDIYVHSSYPEYASASRRDAEHAMSRVADLAVRTPGGPTAVTTAVTPAVGSATRALHDLAEREQASLVAIGSSGRGRVGRVLPGAVTDRLLHAAPCPVAVAPVGFSFEDAVAVPRVIGVAFTDTPDGRAALSTACMLAVRAHGFVRLLTVAEPLHPTMVATLDALALEEVRSARDAEAEATLRRGLDFVSAGRSAGGEILSGDPSDALAAASADFGLLVCGSRGYGPLRTLVVGGTSHALVRKAVCPVLAVPPSPTEDQAGRASDTRTGSRPPGP